MLDVVRYGAYGGDWDEELDDEGGGGAEGPRHEAGGKQRGLELGCDGFGRLNVLV